jgi:hypothetical protein
MAPHTFFITDNIRNMTNFDQKIEKNIQKARQNFIFSGGRQGSVSKERELI